MGRDGELEKLIDRALQWFFEPYCRVRTVGRLEMEQSGCPNLIRTTRNLSDFCWNLPQCNFPFSRGVMLLMYE